MSASDGDHVTATSLPTGSLTPVFGASTVRASPPAVRSWYEMVVAEIGGLFDGRLDGALGAGRDDRDRLRSDADLDLAARSRMPSWATRATSPDVEADPAVGLDPCRGAGWSSR